VFSKADFVELRKVGSNSIVQVATQFLDKMKQIDQNELNMI
jgi:hypothetical protein